METSNDTMLRPSACHFHEELAGQKDIGCNFGILVMPKIQLAMLK